MQTRLRFRHVLISKLKPPRSHRLRNVLQGLRPKIITDDFDLAPNLPIGVIGHTNSARLSNTLQPGGDIDAVAVYGVVCTRNDVAQVQANAKWHPPVFGKLTVPPNEFFLDFNGALNRLHWALEDSQYAVARRIDHLAFVPSDVIGEHVPILGEGLHRGFFIVTH
jgi:hypothetical protein